MSIFDGMDDVFTGVFGEEAVYTPISGAPVTLTAIVEEAGETLVSTGEVDVISRSPYADFRETDIPDGNEGDILSARSKTWRLVGGAMPDGRGMVRWMLELVS